MFGLSLAVIFVNLIPFKPLLNRIYLDGIQYNVTTLPLFVHSSRPFPWYVNYEVCYYFVCSSEKCTLVHSLGSSGFNERVGSHIVSAQPAVVANDECSAATTVSFPFPDTRVNTTEATSDGEICGDLLESAIGVWYTYKSDNDTVVEVVIEDATFSAQLAVFAGPCGNLECLDNITLSWVAYAGIEYRLLVAGSAASTGSFTLKISAVSLFKPANRHSSRCTGECAIHVPSYV